MSIQRISGMKRMFWSSGRKQDYKFLVKLEDSLEDFLIRKREDKVADNARYFFEKCGFVTYPPLNSFSIFSDMKRSFYSDREPCFLDFGSGIGTNLITASYAGFRAYGIEYDEELQKEADRFGNVFQEEYPSLCISNVCGNFFPQKYLMLRAEGKAKLSGLESAIVKEIGRENKLVLTPTTSNPWEKLGTSMDSIDLFFAHLWGPEIPAVIETFSLCAKKGALLIIDAPLKINGGNWEALGLKQEEMGRCKYFLSKYEKIDVTAKPTEFTFSNVKALRFFNIFSYGSC